MMKPPKEISKAKIPRKTIIISYAVIYATSLPTQNGERPLSAADLLWLFVVGAFLGDLVETVFCRRQSLSPQYCE